MNTHNKESVQQRLQMSYGHTEPYIVSHRRNSSFAARTISSKAHKKRTLSLNKPKKEFFLSNKRLKQFIYIPASS